MQSVANRRTFVRHMVIGVPVLAGTTSLPRMVRGSAHDGSTLTPTVETVVRDLARLHNAMKRRGVRSEDVRAVAAHVRALGTYQFESNRDVELVRGIRQIIARDGRQTLIEHRPDPETMRRELAAFGFNLETPLVGLVDTQRRADALDRLARGGMAPLYFDTLFGLDDMGTGLVISGAGDLCAALKDMQTMLESAAAVLCTLAVLLPPAIPECFAASSTLASIKLLILLLGC